ncbi:flagellar hook-basal body protein [Lederbergia graminis]|uniref:Flagellar hook-basal body protein n=1 Tax=Lederbergia graminis TaxID=735518 RepID=A0ABW0LL73_9BACI
MNRSMITATNTISQLQKQFDILSNNIANAQTTGFKKRDVTFADLIVQEVNNQPSRESEIGRLSPHGIRQGTGARIAKSMLVLNQGSIQNTGRALDIAFTTENQFLKVQVDNELRFTRNGALYVTPTEGEQLMLVTQDGNPVLDINENPIVFSNQYNDFTILQDGTFIAHQENGEPFETTFGVIAVNKPQFLEQKGDSLLGLPDNIAVNPAQIYTNLEAENIQIQQRALENSNVDLSKEMTDMITVQRSLQFQSRAITISDQMMGLVNGIR